MVLKNRLIRLPIELIDLTNNLYYYMIFSVLVRKVIGFIVYWTKTSMKKHRYKIDIGPRESGEKPSQRRPLFQGLDPNLVLSKKRELQTANKILLYMQEEEKY